ncbi:MAG TPA: LamG domain-containing protein [Conexibacter sp.]|nr:LamG domain-containing protein [Conexibacter sp.]
MSPRIRLLPLAVLLALALPSVALAGGHGHGRGHGNDHGHGHDHGKPPWAPGPGAPYKAAVLGDQPSAYWRLGERAGGAGSLVAADERHRFDGAYEGGPTLGVAHQLGDGGHCHRNADDDTSADFDGLVTQPLGQWIDVADGDALAFSGHAAFSLEAWIHPRNLNTVTRRVFSKEGPDGGYLIGVRTDGLFFSRYANGLWSTLQAPVDATDWMHVLATYDGTTMRLYVNGALAAERASALELPTERENLSIGAKQGEWRYFAGGLDELAVYDHALSADRAYAHWRVGTGTP